LIDFIQWSAFQWSVFSVRWSLFSSIVLQRLVDAIEELYLKIEKVLLESEFPKRTLLIFR